MHPFFRFLGGIVCLYWWYGVVSIVIALFKGDDEVMSFIWLLPLIIYLLLLIAPYIFYGYYPKWSKKLLPYWLIKAMKADYFKNINTKIKDLPDDK